MAKQWRYGQKSNKRRISVELPIVSEPSYPKPPDCPNGHGEMIYLTHIPFLVDGVEDLCSPNAKAIQYGCAICGTKQDVPTGDPEPDRLTIRCINCKRCYEPGTGQFTVFGNWFCNQCID